MGKLVLQNITLRTVQIIVAVAMLLIVAGDWPRVLFGPDWSQAGRACLPDV
ncbi:MULTISPECIES: hypothetical protein [unclassified Ensifer]|uniref:hypothetical protein n=1 Tax=unclassified Ensifer TaxID=2633371 RepID=UPI000A6A66AD|nr:MULTISPECIES: hypothetical protein [unclassified Ensifer]